MVSKPNYRMPKSNSSNGNIFFIIGEVTRLLTSNGKKDLALELQYRLLTKHEAKSYDEAKAIIGEYVNVVD